MKPNQRKHAEALFHGAVSLSPEEQAAFLEAHCQDAALRAEVEKLLACDQRDGGGLTAPVPPDVAPKDDPSRVSAPGRGDLSRAVESATSTDSSSSFDHGRFVPGTVVSERYRIVGLLGTGGMGEVYRADDLELGQSVALKFLPDRLSTDPRSLDRFRNEVRLARQVSHPNVCRVYDIGQVGGSWFLSMEYVDGEDLSILLRRIGRFPQDRAVEVARQLCLGLEAAHEKEVLHRDLKPANVMVDGRGKVVITDFGLADFAESIEAEDVRSGTPAYMAPEQLTGREVTRQSDIYALGLVLHEVFTGKPVWEADTLAELYKKREHSSAQTPSTHVRDLDPAIERVIERCLEADPRNRPSSALSVAAALPGGDPLAAALAAGETPSPEMVAASGGSGSLRPVVAAALLVFIVVSVALVLVLLRPRGREFARQLPLRPEFLARDAQELLGALGLRDPDALAEGTAYGFLRNSRDPNRVRFWYREGPEHLYPRRRLVTRVTINDPAFTKEGMVTVVLDGNGALRELRVLPSTASTTSAAERDGPGDLPSAAQRDWSEAFRFAGLDPGQFTELQDAEWIPPQFADARWTWQETEPEPDRRPRRVLAAACRGEPVCFRVAEGVHDESSVVRRDATYDYQTMLNTMFLIVTLAAAPLARRNLRRGRGDRKGAFRLGIFFFGSELLIRILGGDHVPDPAVEIRLFLYGVMLSVWRGFSVWLFYLALEPYVRRLWPQALITWSRLLAGRFRDPSIGRDVLVGGACFAAWMLLAAVRVSVEEKFDLGRYANPDLALSSLLGGRFLTAEILAFVSRAVGDAVFFLLMVLLLHVLLRKSWLAVVAFAGIWSLIWTAGQHPIAWIIAMPVFASLAFVLTRYGLVACIASLASLYALLHVPMTIDTTVWYWGSSLYALLFILGLAVYGFWISLGPQSFSGERSVRGFGNESRLAGRRQ